VKKAASAKPSAKTAARPSAKGKPRAKPATKTKAAPKPAPTPVKVGPRHPKALVVAAHGSKAALAATLAKALARADQDTGLIETQLKKASNAQLLRLQRATQTLKEKFGDREKLIAAIGAANKKSKDKDYLTKLDSYSLPQLLDLAAASQRAARAART
jgi:Mrp family chromosome partitioning ATPase